MTRLQEFPQDMPVYRRDSSWDTVSVDDIEIHEVAESDDHDLSVPISERERWKLTAVVIG